MFILTFDLEEWFHINESKWIPLEQWSKLDKRIIINTDIILSFLKEHKIKATFFVLGWIAEYYPLLIKQISNAGHDIGYHSYYHRFPKNQTKKEFENDLVKGLELIKNITGKQVEYYRAPNFSLKNKWIILSLVEHGIKVSSSIKNPVFHKGNYLPKKPFIFTKDNNSLIEFPLNTKSILTFKCVYSGSGYFRLLPCSIIKHMLSKQHYQMLYFHPNDFDHHVPTRKELGCIRNTLNTIGTTTTLKKLENLTTHFQFISITQALNQLNYQEIPKIEY